MLVFASGETALLSTRPPAEGLRERTEIARDEVLMCEVVAEQLDHGWWTESRTSPEVRFRQQEVLLLALPCARVLRGGPTDSPRAPL